MRRLGRWPWIGLGSALTAAQAGVLALAIGGSAGVWGGALVVAGLLQLSKAWLSAMRLSDLGRDPLAAVLTALPPLNLLLLGSLFAASPPDQVRVARVAELRARRPLLGAIGFGLRVVAGGAVVLVPLAALCGLIVALTESVVPGAIAAALDRDPQTALAIFQGSLFVFGIGGLYLILQLFRRRTASRASWLPTLVVLPAAIFALATTPGLASQVGVQGLASIAYGAVSLLLSILLGGIVQPIACLLAQTKVEGSSVDTGVALARWRERWAPILVIHGGVATAIFVGLQALFLPGIILAVSLAYAVPATALDQEPRPLRLSRRLTAGDGARVLTLLTLAVIAGFVVQGASAVAVAAIEAAIDPAASEFIAADGFAPGRVLIATAFSLAMPGSVRVPAIGVGLGAAATALIWAATLAALTLMYRDLHPTESYNPTNSRGTSPVPDAVPRT